MTPQASGESGLRLRVLRAISESQSVKVQFGDCQKLADQGDLGVAGEPGASVEPSRAGLVTAGPCVPVDDRKTWRGRS
jgi:hypothetical protein